MSAKNPEVQFGFQRRQHQSKQIKILEEELEAKTEIIKEYEKLLGRMPDGENIETVIKKNHGTEHVKEKTHETARLAFEGMNMKGRLKRALERDEFQIYYQPIVDVASGRIVGVEALLRWHSSGLGMMYPDRFIPFAEQVGLIVPIGEWVLGRVCSQGKAWQDAGYGPIRSAVNISPVQLQHESFVPMVEKTLHETGYNPRYLEFEITESTVLDDLDCAADTLNRMRAMGISISIDDFGTRYSSLEYINKLIVNSLKMDKSFIKDLDINPNSKAITSAIIAMACNLNLKVTAEGVEKQEQLDFLRQQKCHNFQGYLFSPPIPAREFERIYLASI